MMSLHFDKINLSIYLLFGIVVFMFNSLISNERKKKQNKTKK